MKTGRLKVIERDVLWLVAEVMSSSWSPKREGEDCEKQENPRFAEAVPSFFETLTVSAKKLIFSSFAIFAFPLGTVGKRRNSYASNKRNTLRFKGRKPIFLKKAQLFM